MKEEQKQAVAKILGYTPYDNQLQALYEAFNPAPTEQEVCEALSELKYKLIHMESGVLATSDKLWVLLDLKKCMISKGALSSMLVIVKGDHE